MTLPPITKKQKEILLLLYRFRFLNRIHIQKLLHHKNPKNINVWLQDLTEKKYTGRIYEKTRTEMTIPARYYLAKNAIKFLRAEPEFEISSLIKLHQEKRRSPTFIQKSLFIGDIYLGLVEKNTSSTGFKFYTQSDFPKNGVIRELLPSFAYIKKHKNDIEHYACEVLDEGKPRYAIRGRIKKYIEFFSDDEDASSSHITFICPTDDMYEYVTRFTQKYIEDQDIKHLNIHFTTKEQLKANNF